MDTTCINVSLVIQEVWQAESPEWVDYFLIASNRIIQIHPLELFEVPSLPLDAKLLPARDRNSGSDCSLPASGIFSEVKFICTQQGDDVQLFLSGGSVIYYYLESNPGAIFGNDLNAFKSWPRILFLEPIDQVRLDMSFNTNDCSEPLPIRWLKR
jgi:hypothetical protein